MANKKIFYKFDNILHANKYLKIEKLFYKIFYFKQTIYIYMVIYGFTS